VPSSTLISPRRFIARSAVLAIAVTFGIGPIGANAVSTTESTSPEHLEVVAEQYNLARVNVDRATAALEATDRRIEAARSRVAVVTLRTRARAAALYQGSATESPVAVGDTERMADLHRRSHYLDAAEAPDRTLLTTLSTELRHLAAERTSQRDVRAMLQRNVEEAARLKQRLQTLAAEAAARGPAAGDGAGPLATSPRPTGKASPPVQPPASGGTTTTRPVGTPPPTPPPPTNPAPPPPPVGNEPSVSPGAAGAVAFARAQLGKPYVFATSGPNTFDCSGLTMAAWSSVGVRMPHYSGSQATMFPRVSWEQLKPGDIVAFYGDLHHVGLYIGGGMMIHAPQTGDVVKIAPAWRDTFMWGVRPH
jgi:Cell wall-associated hydrolases (invasion-associated proteins)